MRRVPDACLPYPLVALFLRPIALGTALAIAGTAWGQCETAKLIAPSGDQPLIILGNPVAISGDVAILGAYSDSVNGFVSGSAYIYRYDGWAWTPEAKLWASDGQTQDLFGISVAITDDISIVGASSGDGNSGGSGAAYVFRYDPQSSDWVQEAKLFALDGAWGDQFGHSVSISGDVAIVGAPGDGNSCGPWSSCPSGSAYVFRFHSETSMWVQEAKLLASDSSKNDWFGSSVTIRDDVAIVGAPNADFKCNPPMICEAGAAYVFRFHPATSEWAEETKLVASDASDGDGFGGSVSTDGELVAIGATGNDDAGSSSGSAYVYRFDPQLPGWILETKLVASDGEAFDKFGVSVAISVDQTVVGAWQDNDNGNDSGSAYVYRYAPDTSHWGEEAKLLPVDGSAHGEFGSHLAISDNVVIVGASDIDNDCFNRVGTAYTFDLDDLPGTDCNNNETCDAIDLRDAASDDCNRNGVPDECDIDALWSWDCNNNAVPDECEADCNGNGIQDECEIASGSTQDCNGNGIPDECESYLVDDGSAETAVGSGGGLVDRIWLNQFEIRPGQETITAVGVAWHPLLCARPIGVPATLLVYSDPNDDGDPNDAVLLATVVTDIPFVRSGEFVAVDIDPTFVGKEGESFFIGAFITYSGFFMAIDTSSTYQAASWVASDYAGQGDIEDLSNNLLPPQLIHEACSCQGNWLLRAVSTAGLECLCPADLDGDGSVGITDLLALLAVWGTDPGGPPDFDGDGTVGILDLLVLLANWGPCP